MQPIASVTVWGARTASRDDEKFYVFVSDQFLHFYDFNTHAQSAGVDSYPYTGYANPASIRSIASTLCESANGRGASSGVAEVPGLDRSGKCELDGTDHLGTPG